MIAKPLVVIMLISYILASCAAPTPTPTSIPTETLPPSATLTPSPTATASPSPTPAVDHELKVPVGPNGELLLSQNDLTVTLTKEALTQTFTMEVIPEMAPVILRACQQQTWNAWNAAQAALGRGYTSFDDFMVMVDANGGMMSGMYSWSNYVEPGIPDNYIVGIVEPITGEVNLNTCNFSVKGPASEDGDRQVGGAFVPGFEMRSTGGPEGINIPLAMTKKTPYYNLFYANPTRTPDENLRAFNDMIATFVADEEIHASADPKSWESNVVRGLDGELGRIVFSNLSLDSRSIGKFLETAPQYLRFKD